MLNVGNNLLGSPLGSFGAGPTASLASLASMAAAGENSAAGALSDAVTPAAQPGASAAQPGTNAATQANSIWSGSGDSAGGYISQFMSILFNAYTQLAQYVSGMFGQPPGTGTPSPTPGGSIPQPPIQPPSGGQTFFTSATASSTGDPHDSFDGTTNTGQTVDGGRWNNMSSHPFLLRSQSFYGGFHIATDETQPNQNGVTRNSSVTIDSDFGKNSVTMNRDGSYSVVDNGRQVQLAVGQTSDLGDGESVTRNANNSLTVVDQNGKGGEITTTLRATGSASGSGANEGGGGVNVKVDAQNVNLGGYLVQTAEGAQPGSGTPAPGSPQPAQPSQSAAAAGSYAPVEPFQFSAQQPLESQQSYEPFQAEQWSPGALAGA